MNKTYPINISGILFYINDNAFGILDNYLKALESHYSNTEDGHEIISDIESRIAELLSERVSMHKEVINKQEIENIIDKLGRIEHFEEAENEHNSYQETPKDRSSSYKKKNRKFYRDAEDGIFAGVCSGLAHYIGIDVIIIRMLFILLVIGGTVGFWIYIILWSISHYARTTSEKLEMKGEAVNLTNIEKNIKEEFDKIKSSLNNQNIPSKLRAIITAIVSLLKFVIEGIGKLLRSVFGYTFIIIGIVLLSVTASFFLFDFNLLFINNEQWQSLPLRDVILLIADSRQSDILLVSMFGLLIIPIITITYAGLRLILGFKSKNKYFGIISLILILFSSIIFAYSVADILKEFSYKESSNHSIGLPTTSNTLYVDYMDNSLDFLDSEYIYADRELLLTKDTLLYRTYIKIVEADDSQFRIRVEKTSHGDNKKEALERLGKLNYNINFSKDTISIDQYSIHPRMYRGERVNLYIYKPEGRNIKFISKNSEF